MARCTASSPLTLHVDFMQASDGPPSGEGGPTATAQWHHALPHPPPLNRRLLMSWHTLPGCLAASAGERALLDTL
ncbi:hypothetical protein DHEL01_v211704 [Diaporthe helianthi]|uniref:Uncharacterized protein n=1 Tax=Diaporthe helianthi TaxID=158607 RepID=A0A2P5HI18_DIAHE|nr:hypothetical protein DHEL01_v211704 [Diaporthe helianthi]